MKRKRWRYALVQLDSENLLSARDVSTSIRIGIKDLFGDFGLAQLEYRIIYYDEKQNMIIIKCRRECVDYLKSALLLIKEIKKITVNLTVLKISGTIKKLKTEILI
jgi:ribonuclease P/MRP protein subunit POP5